MTCRTASFTALALGCVFWLPALAPAPAFADAHEPTLEDAPPEGPEQPRVTRRRPGSDREVAPADGPAQPVLPTEFVPISDRWRLMEALGVHQPKWWNPYDFNPIKGDRPLFGEDWFFNVRAISDSVFEPRRLPTPVGLQANRKSGALDAFGKGEQYLLNQNVILSLSLIQGDTTFKPPDWEFRFTPVFNVNYTRAETVGFLYADPGRGVRRFDSHLGIQEAFVDKHLGNVSDRYDFYSIRVGIQGFSTDFRGFLYADNNLGVRFFGNYLNNRIQWNLAAFRRLEKDTNSGLNSIMDLRADDVFLANAYFQDFPMLGFTTQATVVHNRNTEGNHAPHFDDNGFLVRPSVQGNARPHDYHITYFGLNGDGHFERLNVTYSLYMGVGEDERNQIADRQTDIFNYFGAIEASIDYDWYRLKAFALYASGDNDPFDGDANGWDPIFENPNFGGGDTSFWQRQAVPFIGGGTVAFTGRNGLIPSLRSAKEKGQSQFVSPGLRMIGVGADVDVMPELRLIANVSYLWFENTSSLRALRTQGRIGNEIGLDVSGGLLYRPLFIENIVFRLSGAVLFPGDGFKDVLNDRDEDIPYYSVLANLILLY